MHDQVIFCSVTIVRNAGDIEIAVVTIKPGVRTNKYSFRDSLNSGELLKKLVIGIDWC